MAARPPLPTGGPYGSRKKLAEFQQSGDMFPPEPASPAGGGQSPVPPSAPSSAAGGAVTPSAVAPPNVFGPTDRPDEPITEGIPFGPGAASTTILPPDNNMRLRAAYRAAVDNGWDGADDIAAMIFQGRD